MGISGFYGIILLKKNHGINPRECRPGPWQSVHGFTA
jgi:hypothetical protein